MKTNFMNGNIADMCADVIVLPVNRRLKESKNEYMHHNITLDSILDEVTDCIDKASACIDKAEKCYKKAEELQKKLKDFDEKHPEVRVFATRIMNALCKTDGNNTENNAEVREEDDE